MARGPKMTDTRLDGTRLDGTGPSAVKNKGSGWLVRLAGSARVHSVMSRLPGIRYLVRAEGRALFDIVAGFVHSQALLALVELDVLHLLQTGPQTAASLAPKCKLTPDRMQLLLQSAASLGLLKRRRDGRFALSTRGAAFLAVPGLEAMVRHHPVLYRDLADPVAFLRDETSPELARFWPYVFGAGGVTDPAVTALYSGLMADSQGLVANDTLRLVDLAGVTRLLDVGGGTGAFLAAVANKYPSLNIGLFDLPVVVAGAGDLMARGGVANPLTIYPGSFRDDPLPNDYDAISLIRVLYDHADVTVSKLLQAVFEALPPGGLLVVSEPMSGGANPDRATDSYFAFYTAAMQTGRTRSGAEIAGFMAAAGFTDIRVIKGFRPFVTSAVTARRPK
jgi:demethylspheroidene O-methyltransferase